MGSAKKHCDVAGRSYMELRSSCPPICARPAGPSRCFVRCKGTAHHLRQVRHTRWLLSRERSGFPSENDPPTSKRAPKMYGVSPPLTLASGASATGPVSRRATSALSHRADEPPGPQAPGKQARLVHTDRTGRSGRGARMRCPGASVLCLSPPLVALFSHAWPFPAAKATQVFTRNRTSPVADGESPPSRDPTTRPLRRSPRHP